MSKIQVNEIVNHFDTGAPDCPKGLTVTGFSTFTGSSSFSGDVSIGGTLTYEDVTNIDSVGVITARQGVVIGTGASIGNPANNELGLYTNSSERLRIDSSGNIGIGTDNPTVLLDVSGDLSANCKTVGTGGTTDTGKVVGYQQGTWTPKIAQTNDITQVATSYSNQVGKWVRVGNLVTVYFTLNMGASTGLSNTGQALCLIDFPYKSIVQAAYYGSSSSIHANGWTVGQVVFVNILLGQNTTQTNAIYYARSDKNGTYDEANYNSIGAGSLIGSITYLTDNTDWTPINGATII